MRRSDSWIARGKEITRLLAPDYFWFLALLFLYLASTTAPMVFGSVKWQGELDFKDALDVRLVNPDLEQMLRQSVSHIHKVSIRVESLEDHLYKVSWELTAGWVDSVPRDVLDQVSAALWANGFEPTSGARFRTELLWQRSLNLIIWLPLAAILLAFFYWKTTNARLFGFRDEVGGWAGRLLLPICTAIILSVLLTWLYGLFGSSSLPTRQNADELSSLNWQLVLVLVFLIPLSEEIIFRGWLLERFSRIIGTFWALPISAVAFSAIHPIGLTGNLLLLLPGFAWGWLWLRYRSIWICTTSHATYNLLILLFASKL